MNIKKNLLCCATNPICHFVALAFGFTTLVQLIHTHAHYEMEVDVHGYVRNYCRKNLEKCQRMLN